MTEPGGRAVWAGRAISALAGLVFVVSAAMKLKGGAGLEQGFAHLGLPLSMALPLAILEIACLVAYAIPATSIVGAILLTGYMGGAICTHWRSGDRIFVHLALGIMIWLGLWLREDRLRTLIPFRSSGA